MSKRRIHADLIIKWANGAIIEYYDLDTDTWKLCDQNRPLWSEQDRYRVHQEWWENIPTHGVLCWMDGAIVLIVGVTYNSKPNNKITYMRSGTNGSTFYVTDRNVVPLTNDEIEKFKRG